MRRKRRGLSLGSIVMLTITAVVVLGCVALFPKLTGDIDVRVDASRVAVAIDDSLQNLREVVLATSTPKRAEKPTPTPMPTAEAAALAPTQAPDAATPTPEPPKRFTLTAMGSITVDGTLQKTCTADSGYQFDRLFDQLSFTSDMNLATLENTFIATDKLSDVNAPVDVIAALAKRKLNVANLNFTGALNGGVSGVKATQDALRSAGVAPFGVYASQEDRASVVMYNIGGVNVALLGYQSDLTSTGKKKVSKDELAFAISQPTLPTITADIASARAGGAEVVVVSLCWGKENASSPTSTQKELAQGLADAGADVILGTHSDPLQPIEVLTAHRLTGKTSQTLCAYSLGNLLTSDRDRRTSLASLLLHATVEYDPVTETVSFPSLSYTPTYTWRGKEDGKTAYRVLVSNAATQPASVEAEQLKVMNKCLDIVREVMKDSPVKEVQ